MAYEGMVMQWEISKFNLNAVNFMSAHCFPLLQKMLFLRVVQLFVKGNTQKERFRFLEGVYSKRTLFKS